MKWTILSRIFLYLALGCCVVPHSAIANTPQARMRTGVAGALVTAVGAYKLWQALLRDKGILFPVPAPELPELPAVMQIPAQHAQAPGQPFIPLGHPLLAFLLGAMQQQQ